MVISVLMFLVGFLTLIFNFKKFFVMMVVFEMFSLSLLSIFLISKNQLFIFSLFIFVLSAVFGMICFFCFLMFYNNNKSYMLF